MSQFTWVPSPISVRLRAIRLGLKLSVRPFRGVSHDMLTRLLAFPMSSSYSSMPSQSATSGPAPYGQTVSSSPALYQSRPVPSSDASRRHSEYPAVSNADTSYSSFRRISSPYESTPATDYTMSQAPTIPSIAGLTQSPLPSPHLGSNAPASLSQYSHSMSK